MALIPDFIQATLLLLFQKPDASQFPKQLKILNTILVEKQHPTALVLQINKHYICYLHNLRSADFLVPLFLS